MRRRAAPPLMVEVRRYGRWHAALLLLAAAWVLAWTAWAAAHMGAVGAVGTAGACAAAAGWVVRHHWQHPGLVLRWDGQHWHWRPRELRHEFRARVDVCIDLGSWLLLRLRPDTPGCAGRWLPLQRDGLERHWHDLRCAVYSPTPDADPLAGPTSSTA
jgi:hypothetical protein